jgi:hypothetical protein
LHEQRRRLARLERRRRHLDVDVLAVVEAAEGPPGQPLAPEDLVHEREPIRRKPRALRHDRVRTPPSQRRFCAKRRVPQLDEIRRTVASTLTKFMLGRKSAYGR